MTKTRKTVGESEPRKSIVETFAELREIIGPVYDKTNCVCMILHRDRCHYNCPDHEDYDGKEPPLDD